MVHDACALWSSRCGTTEYGCASTAFVEFTQVPAECMHMDTVAWLMCLGTLTRDVLPGHERAPSCWCTRR